MTIQPTLFGHADTTARQGELFARGGQVVDLTCSECGEPLERTPGGFLACPHGHGRLVEAVQADEDRSGLWFTDDDLTADDE